MKNFFLKKNLIINSEGRIIVVKNGMLKKNSFFRFCNVLKNKK